MRRLAWFVAALAAACGGSAEPEAGPLDRVILPTGMAVHAGKLLVASSNADLRFDTATGGTVIALDVDATSDAVRVAGAAHISSFAGDMAVARNVADADPADGLDHDACGTDLGAARAIVANRGSNSLNVLTVSAAGELSCDGLCGIPLPGPSVDPLAIGVACGGGRARAFVGYLRAPGALAWITEYDLLANTTRSVSIGAGPVRAFAYDAANDRLFALGVATGTPTPLRWIDLGGCELGAAPEAGGCTVREGTFPTLPTGLELRSMALAHPFSGSPQRAFLTARLYDPGAAALAGGRTTDLGGVLLVVDLVEDALGGLELRLVHEISLDGVGGLQDVRVLPQRSGKRDVVAALAVDEGELWIYDDDTGAIRAIGRDPRTGVPSLGHQPYGLAVDPVAVSSVARAYVGAFRESFVTPVHVPLDTPDAAFIPTTAAGAPRRITGATP